jgi:tRNA A37 threonylcarbamoyladenosine synthetase subunit TsaC/SUA5/YrdC
MINSAVTNHDRVDFFEDYASHQTPNLENNQNRLYTNSSIDTITADLSKLVVLPTESVFYLTSPEIGKHKLSSKNHSPVHIFASAEQLLVNLSSYPKYLPTLLKAFAPGPLQVLVNNYKNEPIIAYVPNHSGVLLLATNQPITAVPARSKFGIPIGNFEQINKHFPVAKKISGYLNSNPSGIEPTLIDCRSHSQLTILRLGQIPKTEIAKVVSSGVEINEILKQSRVRLRIRQNLLANYFQSKKNHIVVVGSREKLCEQFNLQIEGHFQKFQQNDYTLISLGSQTSVATIAKSLTKNLQTAFEVAEKKEAKLYLLQQSWGNSSWSKVIDYYLSLEFLKGVGQLQAEA